MTIPLLIAAALCQQPAELRISLSRVAADSPGKVASAQVQQPPFAFAEGVATTTIHIGGRALRLEVADPRATPPAQLWIDGDGDGARGAGEVIALAWENATFADVDLQPFGCAALMLLYRRADGLRATVRTLYHFAGEGKFAGTKFAVRWIDMDADGAPSTGDRWVALPAELLARLMLPNSMFAARETDEPWHFGDRELRVVACAADAVTLRWQPQTQPRDAVLAARHERVQRWFDDQFAADRAAFDREHGIDPSRPRAEPAPWYHTLEFADAQRFAATAKRPLLVEFSRDGCEWCKRLPWSTYPDAAVAARLRRFACVRLDTELDPDDTAGRLGLEGVPQVVLFAPDGTIRRTIHGYEPPAAFAAELDAMLAAAGLPPVDEAR